VTVPGLLQQQDQGMEVRYLKEAFISPNHPFLRDPGAGMGGVPAWSVPGLIGGLMGGGGGAAGAGQAAQDAAAAASLCFDFVPGISAVKGLTEAATGIDPVTGQSVGTFGRVCGILNIIPGGKWLGKGVKWAGGAVAKRFPKIAVGVEGILTKVFKRGAKDLLAKIRPAWVKDPGSFVNWMMNLQRQGARLTKEEIDAIVREARRHRVKLRLDPPHPGTPHNYPHLNIGVNGQAHIWVPPGYQLPP
jgi:hypothetical protein